MVKQGQQGVLINQEIAFRSEFKLVRRLEFKPFFHNLIMNNITQRQQEEIIFCSDFRVEKKDIDRTKNIDGLTTTKISKTCLSGSGMDYKEEIRFP